MTENERRRAIDLKILAKLKEEIGEPAKGTPVSDEHFQEAEIAKGLEAAVKSASLDITEVGPEQRKRISEARNALAHINGEVVRLWILGDEPEDPDRAAQAEGTKKS